MASTISIYNIRTVCCLLFPSAIAFIRVDYSHSPSLRTDRKRGKLEHKPLKQETFFIRRFIVSAIIYEISPPHRNRKNLLLLLVLFLEKGWDKALGV